MLLTSLLYIVPRWGTGMDVGAIHALIQLNLANGVFLPLTMAFISFREHHTRTRTRMETAERFAYVDALTGLPNRLQLQRHLDQCLARAQHEGGYVGILFIDLDGFKVINDTLGHAVGDELLSAFGQHLLATRRGALPQVSTTVASAAPRPLRCQSSAVSGLLSNRSIGTSG